jgi:two-component system, chemotaxis family, chemotaxis protein CheY
VLLTAQHINQSVFSYIDHTFLTTFVYRFAVEFITAGFAGVPSLSLIVMDEFNRESIAFRQSKIDLGPNMDTRRILVIDDSAAMCRVVESLLRKAGFENVETVQDGRTAVRAIQTVGFDVIICDWEMEPMNGIEVLFQIRRHHASKATPFILMSAKREPRWVLEAKQAGADCLLAKPFDVDTLKAKISQVSIVPEPMQ